MQKAGGIVALIAGIFGIIAAFMTLAVGGVAGAFGAEETGVVVALGWGGVVFAFLIIVFGAIAMSATSKIPGIILIICAILGAILGGTLVAIFMALAFFGGILAVVGTRKTEKLASQ